MKLTDSISRSISPVGFRLLAVGILVGLISGGMILVVDKDGARFASIDLATSHALITLFSVVLGALLATLVVDVVNLLIQRLLSALTIRMNRLSERIDSLETLYGTTDEGDDKSPSGAKSTSLFAVACVYGYVIGIGISSMMFVYAILTNYTYFDDPLPVEFNSLMADPYMYSAAIFGIAFLCIIIFVLRVAFRWITMRRFEERVELLEVRMGIQHSLDENDGMSSVIDGANEKIMRLLGTRLDERILYSPPIRRI